MHKSTSCKIMKISFVLSVFSGLAACTSDFDVMKERMDVIRQEPRGRVEKKKRLEKKENTEKKKEKRIH